MSDFGIVVALAGHGLTDSDLTSLPSRPLDDGAWGRLQFLVTTQKLTGLLVAAIAAGDLAATEYQFEQARDWHQQLVAVALRLERQMLQVVSALEEHGLDVLVLKGPSVAHLDYSDPTLRLFGDIDILLRSAQFDDGVSTLRRLGFERPWEQMRPGFDARFGKGATLVGPDGLELDAHRTLAFGGFGLAVVAEDLYIDPATFRVGGRQMLALGPAARFLHACYHAALGGPVPRFINLRDIIQLWPEDGDVLARVIDLTHRWRGQAVVARAIRLVEDRLHVDVLAGPIVDAFADYTPTRREQRVLDSQVGADPRFARQVMAALPYVEGWRRKAALLTAAAVPAADSRRSRDSSSMFDWLRRGMDSLRGGEGT